VNLQRYSYLQQIQKKESLNGFESSKLNPKHFTDENLLWDFIVIHWAELKLKEVEVFVMDEDEARAIYNQEKFRNYGGTDE